jgi:hypothetical protein
MVLATPKSKFPWLVPTVAAIGGLALLAVVGRRWTKRGKDQGPPDDKTTAALDDKYVDKLDDELAETD